MLNHVIDVEEEILGHLGAEKKEELSSLLFKAMKNIESS